MQKAIKLLSIPFLTLWCLVFVACQGPGEEVSYVAAKVISATEAYPIALAEAQSWNADAHLTDIEAEVRRVEDLRSLSITFSFESKNDPLSILSVRCMEAQEGFQTFVKTYQYSYKPIWRKPPITAEDWTIDSMQALEIGQHNGGSAFMRRQAESDTEHTAYYRLLLGWDAVLEQIDWTAGYSNPNTLEQLFVSIDPQSGTVLEVIKRP